jgi:RNA polymerase sigma factor (sigma-70 family)
MGEAQALPVSNLMKRERDPTREEFEKLLDWLDADRSHSALKYETIHYRLIRVFASRGCIEAETLVDEVMNRVAVRIDTVTKTYEGEPARCLQGFADKVYLEDLRDQRHRANVDLPVQATTSDEEGERERREKEDKCLTQCMATLPTGDSKLFRSYFQEEKRAKINARKQMAAELRLTVNALRIRAHRIRKQLRDCMEACLSATYES